MKRIINIFLIIWIGFYSFSQEIKVALVIGNADYSFLPTLANPVHDAEDISSVLSQLDFEVVTLTDADSMEMDDAVYAFRRELSKGGVGLFFYAGHGVQYEDSNYLIPVDANIREGYELKHKALSTALVLDSMEAAGNDLNIMMLDACRNNPFSTARDFGRGLSVISAPRGSIVVYATAPGKTAEDGLGRNGTFTSALLNNMETPGIDIKELFDRVGQDVADATGNKQTPWINSSFYGDFYLVPDGIMESQSIGSINTETASFSGTGEILVTAEDGAKVFINGKEAGTAPGLFTQIPAGDVVVEVRKDNYHGQKTVFLSKGSLEEIAIPMELMTGRLLVQTDVSGLNLSIDGKDYGLLTGNVIRDIPAGRCVVMLSGDGLYAEDTVDISGNETASFTPDIRRVGSMKYVLPDGVESRCEVAGKTIICTGTGVIEHIDIGSYSISTTGRDYQPHEQRMDINQGQEYLFEPELETTASFQERMKKQERISLQSQLQEWGTAVSAASITDVSRLSTAMGKLSDIQQMLLDSEFDFPDLQADCRELLGDVELKLFTNEINEYKERIVSCTHINGLKILRESYSDYKEQVASFQYADASPLLTEVTEILKNTAIPLYKEKLDELAYRQEEEQARVKSMNNAGWSLFGIGTSSLAACGVFVYLAQSAYSDYQQATISADAVELWDDLELYQILYWTTGGTGLLLDIIGIPLAAADGDMDELTNEIEMWNVELMNIENDL